MSEGWSHDPAGDRPVPDPGADHLQLHRAAALRPEHGRLGDRAAGLGGVLGVPLGADRAGPLQPADGLPGGAGPLYPPARVPLPSSWATSRRSTAAISFYQRLLARDQDEAEGLIIEQMKAAGSPEEVYDTMLLPALGAIKRNRVTGDITEEDERYALQVDPRDRRGHRRGPDQRAAADRPARGAGRAEAETDGTPAGDPDLRLPGPRRRGPRGPRDAPADPRSGPWELELIAPNDADRRAARPGGRAASRRRSASRRSPPAAWRTPDTSASGSGPGSPT